MMRLAFRGHRDPDAAVAAALQNDPGLPEIISRRVLYYNGNHHAVIGPDAVVGWPLDSDVLDYELEMAVVVGRAASNIDRQQAQTCVFGYTLMNDWSARDIQVDTSRGGVGPCMGKDFATSLGPCIVTADEVRNPHDIALSAWVDGECWSRGSTRNMHYTLDDALSQLSRVSPLVPGEVIGTGTCLGGSAVEQYRQLARGQTVELRAEGIGTLRNRIKD
jgi:2-keto-4-pentenoate hydratase/2-oxohepta-3-ene-1,7-dioic acid hydratase in catechol pathway